MDGKAGAVRLPDNVPDTLCERVLLVGLGREKAERKKDTATRCVPLSGHSNETGAEDAIFFDRDTDQDRDSAWKASQTAVVAMESTYRFDRLKSKVDETPPRLGKITLGIGAGDAAGIAAAEAAMQQGVAIGEAMNLAKDLGNLAPNICTPTYLAEQATRIAKTSRTQSHGIEEKDMEKLGIGRLLAVARGSSQPAKLIVLEYWGRSKKEKPVVLVGKGITFDSGGISLKPASEMDEMKYDMCGAASVLGTITAIAKIRLAFKRGGYLRTTENMPDGTQANLRTSSPACLGRPSKFSIRMLKDGSFCVMP